MKEGEGRPGGRQFHPQLPHPEVAVANIGVVEQHDAAIAQFGQPGLEVMTHCLVGVQAVDVKKVDAFVGEVGRCLVEGLP